MAEELVLFEDQIEDAVANTALRISAALQKIRTFCPAVKMPKVSFNITVIKRGGLNALERVTVEAGSPRTETTATPEIKQVSTTVRDGKNQSDVTRNSDGSSTGHHAESGENITNVTATDTAKETAKHTEASTQNHTNSYGRGETDTLQQLSGN